jgi:hypothetical protein
MSAVRFLNNRYVTFFNGTYVRHSTNGADWTTRTLPTTSVVRQAAYGAGVWVMVGDAGTIITTTDFESFTPQTSGTTSALLSITFAASIFVAVGSNGVILTSANGITWTARSSGTTTALRRVKYSFNTFVAVGNAGTLVYSTDGITWAGGDRDNRLMRGIAYNGTIFTTTRKTSPTGNLNTWTSQYNNYDPAITAFSSTVGPLWANSSGGRFVMGWPQTITDGTFSGILSSPDGVYWEAASGLGLLSIWTGGANNVYFAFGPINQNNGIGAKYSTTGVTWTDISLTATPGLWNPVPMMIAHGNGFYVAVGESLDGSARYHTVWRGTSATSLAYQYSYTMNTEVFPLPGHPRDVFPRRQCDMAYGNGLFVVVGSKFISNATPAARYLTIYRNNADGASSGWSSTYITGSNAAPDAGLAFGAGLFAVTAQYNNAGAVLTSTDAITWTTRSTLGGGACLDVKFLNGNFYAVHDNGVISRSSNGTTWAQMTPPATWTGNNLIDIAYINGQHTLFTDSTLYQRSTSFPGTWTSFTAVTNAPTNSLVTEANGRLEYFTSSITTSGNFVVVTVTRYGSSNGTTWSAINSRQYNIDSTVPPPLANPFPPRFGTGANYPEIAFNPATGMYVSWNDRAVVEYGGVTRVYEATYAYSTDGVNWTNAEGINNLTGVGVVIRDSLSRIRLQSNATGVTGFSARVVKTAFVTSNTTISVPEATNYRIFAYAATSLNGVTFIVVTPYLEYHRNASGVPSIDVIYPTLAFGGQPQENASAYITIFTDGVYETSVY